MSFRYTFDVARACEENDPLSPAHGKILRATMRRIADSEEYAVPATIDDPAILGEIEASLHGVA